MKDYSPPAFPNITPDMNVDGGPGMSLRDYFAAAALAGLPSQLYPPSLAAHEAYRIADEMLLAREL